MNATTTSNFYLSTILLAVILWQDEHMHDIPKTLYGVKNIEVLSFLEFSGKCSY